jgi:hypothetical protein
MRKSSRSSSQGMKMMRYHYLMPKELYGATFLRTTPSSANSGRAATAVWFKLFATRLGKQWL